MDEKRAVLSELMSLHCSVWFFGLALRTLLLQKVNTLSPSDTTLRHEARRQR